MQQARGLRHRAVAPVSTTVSSFLIVTEPRPCTGPAQSETLSKSINLCSSLSAASPVLARAAVSARDRLSRDPALGIISPGTLLNGRFECQNYGHGADPCQHVCFDLCKPFPSLVTFPRVSLPLTRWLVPSRRR